jgi:hypothetical protein
VAVYVQLILEEGLEWQPRWRYFTLTLTLTVTVWGACACDLRARGQDESHA